MDGQLVAILQMCCLVVLHQQHQQRINKSGAGNDVAVFIYVRRAS
jgi:hypothetical protein